MTSINAVMTQPYNIYWYRSRARMMPNQTEAAAKNRRCSAKPLWRTAALLLIAIVFYSAGVADYNLIVH
jgi:hypothetical protein